MSDEITARGSKVKLVVCDMDGTLLNPEREITKINRAAIQKAKDQDILFSICTGRIATMVEYYTESLEIITPIIAANGAMIWDPVKKMPVYEIPMEEEELLGILERCSYYKMDYSALTLGINYFSKNSIRINRFLDYNRIAEQNGYAKMQFDFFDEDHSCVKDLKIHKLLIYDTHSKRLNVIEEYLKTLKKTAYTSSEPGLLDVSEVRVNKGFGIKKLAELLVLDPQEVCAIGDYDNDIPMLDYAGFPVAMGNACEELKNHALLITKSNAEDGVAWAMNQYILRR